MLVKLTLVLFACAVVSIQAAEVKANAKANVAVGHTTPATAKGKSKEKPTPKPKPTKPPKTPPTPKTTAAPGTPPPKPGKYNCAVCTGQGSDCKATSYDKNVDWCAKINGTVEDPKNVPSAFFSIFQFAGLGDLKKMSKFYMPVGTISGGLDTWDTLQAPPRLVCTVPQH